MQFDQEFQRVVFDRPGYYDPVNKTYNSPDNNTASGVPNRSVTNFFPGVTLPVSINAVFNASGQAFSIDRKNYDDAFGYFAPSRTIYLSFPTGF